MNGRSDISKAIVRDYDGLIKGVKFTLTPNGPGTEMQVLAQFLTYRPNAVPKQNRHVIEAWFSTTPGGAPIAAAIAPIAEVSGSVIAVLVAGGATPPAVPSMFKAKLNPVCQLAVNIAPVATIEYYLNVNLPDGRIVTSPKIAITI